MARFFGLHPLWWTIIVLHNLVPKSLQADHPVPVLAPLVLTDNNDAGWTVRQTNRTERFIYMLPALAASTKRINIALGEQGFVSCGYCNPWRLEHLSYPIIKAHIRLLYQKQPSVAHRTRTSPRKIDYTRKLMKPHYSYAQLAVLMELNNRESTRKRGLFSDELRYFAMLAGSIVGAELAKRVMETPEAVIRQSESFVQHLTELAPPAADGIFQEVLATYLVETLKDELRFCCANCRRFFTCLDTENLAAGELFRRRTNGEDSEELKTELTREIEEALTRTPYLTVEIADELCPDFMHTCTVADLGCVISRYAEIAAFLRERYGLDYRNVQEQLVTINIEFAGRYHR